MQNLVFYGDYSSTDDSNSTYVTVMPYCTYNVFIINILSRQRPNFGNIFIFDFGLRSCNIINDKTVYTA